MVGSCGVRWHFPHALLKIMTHITERWRAMVVNPLHITFVCCFNGRLLTLRWPNVWVNDAGSGDSEKVRVFLRGKSFLSFEPFLIDPTFFRLFCDMKKLWSNKQCLSTSLHDMVLPWKKLLPRKYSIRWVVFDLEKTHLQNNQFKVIKLNKTAEHFS